MTQPRSRQELYERIRQTSKEQFILEEMIRLGFWGQGEELPGLPPAQAKRRGEIIRRMRSLQTEAQRTRNREALLKAIRKRRMQESRERRALLKLQREETRRKKAQLWQARKAQEILYLGPDVSQRLSEEELDLDRLNKAGLPSFSSAQELAQAMGITLSELRFLAFERKVSERTHYIRFAIPKKSGGLRRISAPMPRLKQAQRWVLDEILRKIPVHEAAHGFLPGRSILSNAQVHTGQRCLINLDLADFFPSISYRRIRGFFHKQGYSESLAVILGLLCTEAEISQIELDGRTWYLRTGARSLPQGSPASPALSNLLCRRLDRRLSGLANRWGYRYTRYADDLSFSGGGGAVGKLIQSINYIVKEEGFRVHPEKTRVEWSGRRQEVTGLVVNQRVGVPRALLRRFRATLFQIERDGPKGKRWGASEDLFASLRGFASFVFMVAPEKGLELKAWIDRLSTSQSHTQQQRQEHQQQRQEHQQQRQEHQQQRQEPQRSTEEAQKQRRAKWLKLL